MVRPPSPSSPAWSPWLQTTRCPAVLVHCTAGKDRTGVAIALLLDAVGAERTAVIGDYASSEANLSGAWAERMFTMIAAMGVPRTAALDELIAATPAAAIAEALAWVDREHGGSAGLPRLGWALGSSNSPRCGRGSAADALMHRVAAHRSG